MGRGSTVFSSAHCKDKGVKESLIFYFCYNERSFVFAAETLVETGAFHADEVHMRPVLDSDLTGGLAGNDVAAHYDFLGHEGLVRGYLLILYIQYVRDIIQIPQERIPSLGVACGCLLQACSGGDAAGHVSFDIEWSVVPINRCVWCDTYIASVSKNDFVVI